MLDTKKLFFCDVPSTDAGEERARKMSEKAKDNTHTERERERERERDAHVSPKIPTSRTATFRRLKHEIHVKLRMLRL